MQLNCVWDRFGWVAQCSDPEIRTAPRHCAGQRQAADRFCRDTFPAGTWRLHFVRRGQYKVEMLP